MTKLPVLMKDSPFKPIIPERMVWTSSSLKLFRKCKRKFFWKYIMRLRTLGRDKNLLIGSGFHHALGQWYRGRRSSMQPIAERMVQQMTADAALSVDYVSQADYDDMMKAMTTFTGMVVGYERIYNADRHNWRFDRDLIEKRFVVDCGRFCYSGKIDLVMRRREGSSRRTLVEHKTTSKIRTDYIRRLPIDTQCRGYVFGAIEGLGVPVDEVLYDVVAKCKLRRKTNETIDAFNKRIAETYASEPDRWFYREMLPFHRESLESFKYDLHQTHKEYEKIIAPLTNPKLTSKERLQLLFEQVGPDNPHAWTPNDATCDEFFRVCPYIDLCLQGLDRGTCRQFEQGQNLHEELADED